VSREKSDTSGDPEPATASPGSLIVTFAGLYLRDIGDWIAVADLLALLESAGQPAVATRQALVRLKSRDFLRSERQGGRAGYRLTDAGRADLEVGDARIFRYGQAPESAGWVLAVFSVPEQARAERHRLRSRLSWLGFGTVAAGVWIAPATLADRARAQLESQGLGGYVSWFSAEPLQPADVNSWWDLEALRSLYSAFLHQWSTVDPPLDDAAAFAAYLQLVDSWRRFPRIDPGLPESLLPPGWAGRRAFDLFAACSYQWRASAARFVAARLGAGPSPGWSGTPSG
jgi:phenylacetic acid degradation operon negative regulatory protein